MTPIAKKVTKNTKIKEKPKKKWTATCPVTSDVADQRDIRLSLSEISWAWGLATQSSKDYGTLDAR